MIQKSMFIINRFDPTYFTFKRYEGIAHFLEHMLFLGTEKYPIENEYERYILDRNGHFNAYTASDHTAYYFTITPTVRDIYK